MDPTIKHLVITMNRAAEQAVPKAAAVLLDSVKQMSIADARSILTGTNNATTPRLSTSAAPAERISTPVCVSAETA